MNEAAPVPASSSARASQRAESASPPLAARPSAPSTTPHGAAPRPGPARSTADLLHRMEADPLPLAARLPAPSPTPYGAAPRPGGARSTADLLRRAAKDAPPIAPLLLAAGCAVAAGVADPPLAQLSRWRTAGPDAIAAEPVVAPCPVGNPACSRLHALRAEACLGRALAARAPGAACPASRTAPLLDCAAEGYAAAIAARGGGTASQPSTAALRAGLAQSLLCRAEFDTPAAATVRAAAAAEAAEGAPPDEAALHGARAALLLARLAPGSTERCAAARRALRLSARAAAEHRARLHADALHHLRSCEAPTP